LNNSKNHDFSEVIPTESALIDDILRGDRDLYAYFVSKYKTRVFAQAYRIVRNYHTAEDIAQEVFVSAYMNLSKLTDKTKFLPWVLTSVRNRSINYLTRATHISDCELHELLIAHDSTASPEHKVLEHERSDAIRMAFSRLPNKIRSVAMMYFIEKHPAKEICTTLGISENLARSRIHDAREYLKKELVHMSTNEQKQGLSSKFDKKIRDEVTALSNYYHLNNFSYDGYDDVYDRVKKKVDAMTESTEKHYLTAAILACNKSKNPSDIDKLFEEARLGQNSDAISDAFIEKYIISDDFADKIESEGYPLLEGVENSANALGELNFWRASGLLKLKFDYAGAREYYTTSLAQLNKDNVYYANAVSALRTIDILEKVEDTCVPHMNNIRILGETYRYFDGKMYFIAQPGTGWDREMHEISQYDCLLYFASDRDRIMFAEPPECFETVTVKAGTFENCMKTEWKSDFGATCWYAPRVGLVRIDITWGEQEYERYELCEYSVSEKNSGSAYLPFAEGNFWNYKNTCLSDDEYAQFIEYKITNTYNEYANFSVVNALFKKK